MVPDRIEKVKDLIARFPDRSEYTISTSEFESVKRRLVAQTNARAASRPGGAAERDAQRPSLKKRQPSSGDPNATGAPTSTGGDAKSAEPAADRPTLKKKGESSSKTDPEL